MTGGSSGATFVAGRATLRAILSRYVGGAPATLQVAAGDHGKPFLVGGDDLRFNLSHTGSVALYAVARGREVGIDVERLDRRVPCLRLARRFFSPEENDQLRSLPEALRRPAFFAGWVRKEALVKAWGLGLSAPLDRFDVCLLPDWPPQLLEVRGRPGEADRWSLLDVDAGEGHAAALAVEGQAGHVTVRAWDRMATAPLPPSR